MSILLDGIQRSITGGDVATTLPHYEGRIPVPKNSAFLIGPDSEWSFDSRYFGVVRREEIQRKAEMLRFTEEAAPNAGSSFSFHLTNAKSK